MLKTLKSIVQSVNNTPNLESALNIIVSRVASAMNVAACTIYLLNPVKQRYFLRAAEGLNASAVGTVSLGINEGLVGLVGSRAEPVNLKEASKHPNFRGFPELQSSPYHGYLGVPIMHHRRVLGVINVRQREKHKFNDDEEAFLVTLAAQLAGVIAHTEIVSGQDVVGRQGAERVDGRFQGVPGPPGFAIGRAVVMYPTATLNAVPDRTITDIDQEIDIFRKAVQSVQSKIHELETKLADHLQPEYNALFDVYLQMLDDNALIGEVEARIREGNWAQSALKDVIFKQVARFNDAEDIYLRERGDDIRQLGQHILTNLQQAGPRRQKFPDRTVLIAEDLSPAMLGEIPREQLVGMVSMSGSANSHIAILAGALNVPTVMGVVDLPHLHLEGREVIVDSFRGHLYINPSSELRARYEATIKREQDFSSELEATRDMPCETLDGHRVRLWVNVNFAADIGQGLSQGTEGVGLYRTEFPFMHKERFPTEEEQRVLYREHMEKIAPRDITMRTLDIGGDKSLPYFPITEANPFLGWRGIRVTLDHPEILVVQVRAILKAHTGLQGTLRIMLPMITNIREIEEARRLITRCHQEIVEEGYQNPVPLVGVMIEIPAAAYQADTIAQQVDFIAVGSNDLTQYMLAVDRNNPRVAELYKELHPAMLKTLKLVADATLKAKKPISICGELAASPTGAVLLIAMGYEILSMNAIHLPRIRWAIRNMSMKKARQLLKETLVMDNAEQIEAHMAEALRDASLGRLLQPSTLA